MHGEERNILSKRDAERYKEEQIKQETERARILKGGDVRGYKKIIQESDVARPPAVL